MTVPNVLSIAGSDPSGGAGIQADLKAFSACGVYGMAAITALTAQNTQGVTGVEAVAPDFVTKQIDAVFADIRVDAVKIGMVANAGIARAIARSLARWSPRHVVLDPVMVAKSGHSLLAEDAIDAVRTELVPLASLLTPNLPEAAVLLCDAEVTEEAEMPAAATRLLGFGCRAALLKGGHLAGNASPDLLALPSGALMIGGERIVTENTHGTGCTLSSAIAAHLALTDDIEAAVRAGKSYVAAAIAGAGRLSVGSGHGPTHHFHSFWPC